MTPERKAELREFFVSNLYANEVLDALDERDAALDNIAEICQSYERGLGTRDAKIVALVAMLRRTAEHCWSRDVQDEARELCDEAI